MKTLLLILFPFMLTGQIKPPVIDDAFKHHYAGVIITTCAAYTLDYFIEKPFISASFGLGMGMLAGELKELYDARKGGTGYNKWDRNNTFWGSAEGFFSIQVYFAKERETNYINDSLKFQNLNTKNHE